MHSADEEVARASLRCTYGLIDVHAHCLPSSYKTALAEAGLMSLDGGFPIPDWSPQAAIDVMNRGGIDSMVLSASSRSVHFLEHKNERVAFARRLNDGIADIVAEHPGRFGGLATLPLPHVDACVVELRRALGRTLLAERLLLDHIRQHHR